MQGVLDLSGASDPTAGTWIADLFGHRGRHVAVNRLTNPRRRGASGSNRDGEMRFHPSAAQRAPVRLDSIDLLWWRSSQPPWSWSDQERFS